MKMLQIEKKIPVVGEYDVVVCGGGPAGWVAAVSAARCGKRVALIERLGFFGGTATGCAVVPISGFYFRGKRVVGGIAWEFVERLMQSDAALPEMPANDDYVGGDGSLLAQCIEMAVNDGQVSTSLIQRRLRLGYARAGRLVDEMEKRGIVGPKDGAKPRMCLISREEFERMKENNELDD